MPKCEICGKSLNNPNSASHINSKYHQEKLKSLKLDKKIGFEEKKTDEIVLNEIKKLVNSKFTELEKLMIKERLYDFINRNDKSVTFSDLIFYFQKFFNSILINSLLTELYFEKLIDFKPKVPQEIEDLLRIISKKFDLIFPLSIKLIDLENIIKERFLNFDKILNKLKEYPDYVQFSPLSIGKSNEIVIFKNFWKSNSQVKGVN